MFTLLLTGVIWPVLTNRLLNEKGFSLHWTLRIIAFMQLALMVAATLLIQPRFARSRERELLPLRRYFADKRTVLFTFALLIMNLGIYIPWVSSVACPNRENGANQIPSL